MSEVTTLIPIDNRLIEELKTARISITNYLCDIERGLTSIDQTLNARLKDIDSVLATLARNIIDR